VKFFLFALNAVLVFLVSCSTGLPNQNQDPNKNNQATYRKDLKECQEDYPQQNSGVHLRQWISCMNEKGWK
jgi:hypothetical protein